MRLHDYVDYHAREAPDAEFATFGEVRLSYGQASEQINRVADAFDSSGVRKGARIAILSKNSLEYVILYFAASKAGVVPVPLNYRLVPSEWAYIINDARAEMLIASPEYMHQINGIRGELETAERLVVIGEPGQPGWTDYRGWVTAQSESSPVRSVESEDDAVQMYTSGTTGRPKGAVVTHANLITNQEQSAPDFDFQAEERHLLVAPLFHVAGLWITISAVRNGSSLYIQEDFDAVEVVRTLDEEQIHWAVLVPAMIQACLVAVPDAAHQPYADLRGIIYAGSPIAVETLRQAMNTFKCEFRQLYGMTELSPIATILSPEDHRHALDGHSDLLLSGGRAISDTDVRIVDEYDEPVPNGTMGEIVVRGPQVMRGYWNLPGETAAVIRDGWMHTGDAGTMDDDGYIYVQDRVKDMIVSGGENVYPRAVEEVLFAHPSIKDAAVIGVPDDRWGETVKAVVVVRDGHSLTEEDVMEFCRGRIGGFERPRSVDFVIELPRNPSGKVLKRELREPYWEGRGRRVAGA